MAWRTWKGTSRRKFRPAARIDWLVPQIYIQVKDSFFRGEGLAAGPYIELERQLD